MAALSLTIALFCLLPLAALLLVDAMPGVALQWDFANVAGLLAAIILLLLFHLNGRPLERPRHDGKFFRTLHRDLAFAAGALSVLHVGVLLYDEPLLLNHLLPSAPGYMLAGLGAALVLVLLVMLSLTPMRRRLWRDHRQFRRWHYRFGLVIVALIAWHVLGAGFYLHAPWKVALWLLLTLALAIWPRLPRAAERSRERRRRHTAPLATGLSLAVVLLGLLLAGLFALIANSDLPT